MFKENKSLGLDIGYDVMRIVELKKNGSVISIHSFNAVKIPKDTLTKDGIIDKKALVKTFNELIAKAGPKPIDCKNITTGLSEIDIFSKIIEIPRKTKKKDFKNTVIFKASESIPWPVDDSCIDWIELPPSATTTKDTLPILIIASAKKIVEDIQSTVSTLGYKLFNLETKPIANARALIAPSENKPLLIVDIGADHTICSIVADGVVYLSTSIAVGSNQVAPQQETLASAQQPANDINTIAKPLIENIIQSIKYYQERINSQKKVAEVRISGAVAPYPNLDKIIQQTLNIPTVVANPTTNIKLNVSNMTPELLHLYTVAIGLALRDLL